LGGHLPSPVDVREYAAKYSEADKCAAQTWWAQTTASATINVMVATSAFGTGLDSPDVRTVVMIGDAAPRLLDFAQMAGRAGRDGQLALCASSRVARELATSQSWKQSTVPGTGDVRAWARDATQCRARALHLFLDGETG
jgi:superfamily II DNA helicase RecQ